MFYNSMDHLHCTYRQVGKITNLNNSIDLACWLLWLSIFGRSEPTAAVSYSNTLSRLDHDLRRSLGITNAIHSTLPCKRWAYLHYDSNVTLYITVFLRLKCHVYITVLAYKSNFIVRIFSK